MNLTPSLYLLCQATPYIDVLRPSLKVHRFMSTMDTNLEESDKSIEKMCAAIERTRRLEGRNGRRERPLSFFPEKIA